MAKVKLCLCLQPIYRREGIFEIPIIFSPPQPINTAESKKKTYPCKGKTPIIMVEIWWREECCLCSTFSLSGLCLPTFIIYPGPSLNTLGEYKAEKCSDCFHPFLAQPFKNSSNIFFRPDRAACYFSSSCLRKLPSPSICV